MHVSFLILRVDEDQELILKNYVNIFIFRLHKAVTQ